MSSDISVFDMLKIGVGPSSSHTLGPWKAALAFLSELRGEKLLTEDVSIEVHLYGSLALTGAGHGTDIAILLGLSGEDPETVPLAKVASIPAKVKESNCIDLAGSHSIPFDISTAIQFHSMERLPFHANGMKFEVRDREGQIQYSSVYYSIGGGFITHEDETAKVSHSSISPPYAFSTASELARCCDVHRLSISDLAWANEMTWKSSKDISGRLDKIWNAMANSMFRGCHSGGHLPGGLKVNRRAAAINKKLLGAEDSANYDEWTDAIRNKTYSFPEILKWVSCFAMAVNEENASFGRIVTAPTNGAAGVIPAVLQYLACFAKPEIQRADVHKFLLTASVIGCLFKHKATISAAMGGCQAEIGVSSSMAAAALTEGLGGDPHQALTAAEIAMEHHLGLTCDPIQGLVQIPCIERNCMGAVKAITAANLALETSPGTAKVTLDAVIQTMWETAQDMNHKYKETSQGGLATNVRIIEC